MARSRVNVFFFFFNNFLRVQSIDQEKNISFHGISMAYFFKKIPFGYIGSCKD